MSFASNYTLFVFFAVGADASERRYVSLPDTDAWKRRLLLGRSRFVFFVFFDVEKFLWFDFPPLGPSTSVLCFPCEITLVLSEVFAGGRVLAAFFRCCGTLVHRRREMGLNRIGGDNQRVGKGRFEEGS